MQNTKDQGILLCVGLKKNVVRLSSAIFFIAVFNVFSWNQTEFVLFTFFDPCLSANTDTTDAKEVHAALDRFQKAKDAYFNLLTGTQFPPHIVLTQAGMDFALFIAGRVPGIRYLVVDKRYRDDDSAPAFRPYQPAVATTITNHYNNELAGLFPLRRNALMGYNLGDEPRPEHAHAVNQWISYFKRSDDSKLAYVNLLPSYGFANRKAYEAYLDNFISDSTPDVVCFDHYPFFKDKTIRKDYFYNLRIIQTKAGNRPFWTFIQSVDHLGYVNPSAEHFRFMAFCPIAYGAKGLGYFTYERPDDKDYRDALVNACDARTEKYDIARTINHYVQKVIGPVVMNSTNKGAFHASKKPTGEKDQLLTPTNAPLMRSIGNENCLVGVFQSKAPTTTWYCLVVNKSLSSIHDVVVTFKGNFSGKLFKAPSLIGYTGDTTYSPVTTNPEGIKMTIAEILGGEGQLFRVTQVPYQ
jgi:hypothetical protein